MDSMFRSLRTPTVLYSAYGAAVILLAVLYFGSLGDQMLDVHDAQTFRDNVVISRDFAHFFSPTKEHASGRPTAELAKWLLYLVVGPDPRWHHWANVVAHALVSFLLPFACRSTGLGRATSFLAGLLFLINVAHFQAVHWITQLDYLLALLFGLIAVILFKRFLDTRRSVWIGAAALSFLLGAGAHAAMVMLAPVAVYWTGRAGLARPRIVRWSLAIGFPTAGLVLGILLITERQAPSWDAFRLYGSTDALLVLQQNLEHLLLYVGRLLTTAHWILVPFYRSFGWEGFAGWVLIILLAYVILRRIPGVDFWAVWTLAMLIPFIFIPTEGLFQSPTGFSRYLYVASAGSSLLLAWLIERAFRRLDLHSRTWGIAFAAAALVALAASSYRSLKQVEILSIYSSARHYMASGDLETGIEFLQRALAPSQEVIPLEEVYFRLASAISYTGADPQPVLREGLALIPNSFCLNMTMAVIEQESADPAIRERGQRRFEESRARAVRTRLSETFAFNVSVVYHNLGKGYVRKGHYIRAIHAYQQALAFKPDKEKTIWALSDVYVLLGIRLREQQRVEEAVTMYRKALEYNPSHIAARKNLGGLFFLQKRWEEAIDQYQAILEREPHSYALFNVGLAQLANGDVPIAEATYDRAIRQFGLQKAREIGAINDIKYLIRYGIQVAAARRILQHMGVRE